MSMQIGPMPLGYVTQQDIRHVALRQAEPRTTDFSYYSPWKQNPDSYNTVDIKTTAQDLEHVSQAFNRRLKFEVDHESKEVFVKVIDTETDKVIKVLPPEELQRLHRRIEETLGFLFDQMV